MTEKPKSAWVDINELVSAYLPMSRRKARKFAYTYLNPVRVGNRIYIERRQLETLLNDPNRERFPLNL